MNNVFTTSLSEEFLIFDSRPTRISGPSKEYDIYSGALGMLFVLRTSYSSLSLESATKFNQQTCSLSDFVSFAVWISGKTSPLLAQVFHSRSSGHCQRRAGWSQCKSVMSHTRRVCLVCLGRHQSSNITTVPRLVHDNPCTTLLTMILPGRVAYERLLLTNI